MAPRCIHVVILIAAWALVFHSSAAHAQAGGNIMVVEKHVGGSTIYCLRNGGRNDAFVTVSFTNLSSGQRINTQLAVAAQAYSTNVTTSDSSTKPVITSVQFAFSQGSGTSSGPLATP